LIRLLTCFFLKYSFFSFLSFFTFSLSHVSLRVTVPSFSFSLSAHFSHSQTPPSTPSPSLSPPPMSVVLLVLFFCPLSHPPCCSGCPANARLQKSPTTAPMMLFRLRPKILRLDASPARLVATLFHTGMNAPVFLPKSTGMLTSLDGQLAPTCHMPRSYPSLPLQSCRFLRHSGA
jgi:hypothetical protein